MACWDTRRLEDAKKALCRWHGKTVQIQAYFFWEDLDAETDLDGLWPRRLGKGKQTPTHEFWTAFPGGGTQGERAVGVCYI